MLDSALGFSLIVSTIITSIVYLITREKRLSESEQKDKLTYISTGMTDQKYVNYILNKFKNRNIVLMHAISSYPTKFENINLNIISEYKKLSEKNKNIIPGYSSHDVGYFGCMLAISERNRGASHTYPCIIYDRFWVKNRLDQFFFSVLARKFCSVLELQWFWGNSKRYDICNI